MLLGIVLMNIFFNTGLVDLTAKVVSPVIKRMMGLPETVVVALMMGFLLYRKLYFFVIHKLLIRFAFRVIMFAC